MSDIPNPLAGPVSWELLDRYLAGECSAEEREVVHRTLKGEDVAATVVDALRPNEARPFDIARGLANVRRSRATADVRSLRNRHTPRMTGMTAVTFGVICVVSVFTWRMTRRASSLQGTSHTYTTAVGQRSTLTLADGSHVTLAPSTSLTIHNDSRIGERAIELEGEAFFTVTSHAQASFVVRTGRVETRVLGTTFDVRKYANESHARVAVQTGKVVVAAQGSNDARVTLGAGETAHATDSTVIVTHEDAGDAIAWTSGRLVFDRAPVRDVLQTLERWYGYHFNVADPNMLLQHVTTTLDYRASSDALSTLALLLDAELAKDGQVITLRPRRAERRVRTRDEERHIPLTTMEIGR